MTDALPVDAALPALRQALGAGRRAILVAPPGSGKTTRVPLALMAEPWLGSGRIVMLEPRRIAARAAARFMASMIGEAAGERVGYRVRHESRVGSKTRVEVVTEGILTRRLQSDPELSGIGLLIFDEFHERSLDSDLGLALALDAQESLRPDLRILVMSATLDAAGLSRLLGDALGGDAPVIAAGARSFPVETRYRPPARGERVEDAMAAAVRAALAEQRGSVLAFLPGEAEIRRAAERLAGGDLPAGTDLCPLYGALPAEAQDRAIRPAIAGRRKVVLATTIAETSLTIEGVTVVIDSGWKRAPRFDPSRGMARLETVRVSAAAATQREGRAGRLGPGVCYRLWSVEENRALAAFDLPEILAADLAAFALELAAWGVGDPARLKWLDPPPPAAFAQAVTLLRDLGALDPKGHVTAMGRAMAELPLHPRLAHMVLAGKAQGAGPLAAAIAALIEERDFLAGERDADIRSRLEVLVRGDRAGGNRTRINRAALARVAASWRDLLRRVGLPTDAGLDGDPGALLALAYPDRIGQRRGPGGRYRLSGGGGVVVAEGDGLAASEFLAVATTDGAARDARVFLAAPLARQIIEQDFAAQILAVDDIRWDGRDEAVLARRQRRLGALVLDDKPLPDPDSGQVSAAMVEGVRSLGLAALPWSMAAKNLKERVNFLRTVRPEDGWPDLSDAGLMPDLDIWLQPYLAGITRRAHLARLDLAAILLGLIPPGLAGRLDRLAPPSLAVPSGARLLIDYGAEGGPRVRVRVQEVFGLAATPRIADGRIVVAFELLSPARRPVALTRDLQSFWANVYPQVRAELRGRYPKHAWPENPLTAQPVAPGRPR
ncbi:MAG: ATP-dependent helicase HrpB [Alphaproteobacteria bacterium]